MRNIVGLALSTVLFYLSNRMGVIIKLTGRGWQRPYRAYYKLVHASQRARAWGQPSPGNTEQGEQLKVGALHNKRAPFGPHTGRIVTPLVGRDAYLASSGRGALLFSGSGNETVVRQGSWSADTVKPYGRTTAQT
jgi:hypothetical protein